MAAVLAPVAALAACGGSNSSTASPGSVATSAAGAATSAAGAATSAAQSGAGVATSAAESGAGTATSAATSTKVGIVYDIGGKGDKSFNDAAFAGVTKAKTDLGIDFEERSPNSSGTDRGDLMQQLAQAGDSPVIGVGFLFEDAIKKVAPKFPKTQFAIIDDVVAAPNITSLVFTEEQSSYLVGVAAALKSTSGTVGFIGGVQTPLLQKFQAGYAAGVTATKPGDKVLVKYLSQPPDFSGFAAPDKGKVAAQGFLDAGADVVYAAAGGSGKGAFTAVTAANKAGKKAYAIGVDSDQELSADAADKPYILTSAIKRIDTAVFGFIKSFSQGSGKGGTEVFDLKADGVGYATSGGLVDDIATQLEAAKAKIVAGTVKVPTKP